MKQVSNILPFLLIGGFSQNEIVSYLKAKLEAAKSVKGELDRKDADEDSMVESKKKAGEAENSMTMSATAEEEEKPKDLKDISETPVVGEPLKPQPEPGTHEPLAQKAEQPLPEKEPGNNTGQGGGAAS